MTRRRIAIVGGGLAGLSAAESLVRFNSEQMEVVLFESKRQVGGRTGSFVDVGSGESIDYCQHVAMGCCTNFIQLMRDCALDDEFETYRELTFLHPSYPASPFAPSAWLPAPLHLRRTLKMANYLKRQNIRQIERALWRLMRAAPRDFENVVAADWLRKNGQSPDTIARYWDVILVSALGESTEFVAMSAARKVMIDGFAAAKGASDVLVPRLSLSTLIGQRLSGHLTKMGIQIQSQTRVRRITHSPIGLDIGGDHFAADHVISAVPWYRLGDVLGDDILCTLPKIQACCKIPTSPITGIHLWFDRRLMDIPHAVLVGTMCQWIFRDPTWSDDNSTVDEDGYYYQVVISADHDRTSYSKDEIMRRVLDELKQVIPACRTANLLRSRIVTDPNSVFSVRPEVESVRPPSRTKYPWLHFAGDWIGTGWPATMEGAVISGKMAANSVRESLGFEQQTIHPGLRPNWLSRKLIRQDNRSL